MANELMTLEQASMEIDKIVLECAPFAGMQMTTFSETLKLADGIRNLREIFLKHPGIKSTIEAMKDTELGFLTDRSPAAVAKAQNTEKKISPYKYEEVAECCINAMLKGYRLTNNEFNVIAGKFYPAKNGKYRKIIEHEDVTDFKFTNTSPVYEAEGKYAKVRCYASWRQKGKKMSLGLSDQTKGEEDTLVFRIRVNAMMGEDAIVGKALSKLFSRVLTRIDGRVMPESTDLEPGELAAATDVTPGRTLTPEGEPLAEPYKVNGAPPINETPKDDPKPEKKTKGKEPEKETDKPDQATLDFLKEAAQYKAELPKEEWKKLVEAIDEPEKVKPTMRQAFLRTAKSRLDKANAK